METIFFVLGYVLRTVAQDTLLAAAYTGILVFSSWILILALRSPENAQPEEMAGCVCRLFPMLGFVLSWVLWILV